MSKVVSVLCLALSLFLLVGVGPASAANLLVNPGFESPSTPVSPPEYYGAASWTSFGGGIYTISSTVGVPPNTGNQLLKMFGGCCSGAFQQFPASPGQSWNGGVWMRNDSLDPMAGGQVAAVNIEWIRSDGSNSTIIPFISNGTFTAATAPRDVWTLKTITGVAPADAAFARLVLITGDFDSANGGPGGAPFFDDAFFEVFSIVSTEPTTWGKIKSLYR